MSPMPRNTPQDVWKRIDRRGDDECWPFVGAVNTYGYGQFALDGKQVLAHRLAYALTTGIEPGALLACHTCDNPRCCNPAHIFLGTVADNTRDAVAKRRHAHGETSGTAKLSAEDVTAIRAWFREGKSFVWLARRFRVTPENVSYICRRQTWKHVA